MNQIEANKHAWGLLSEDHYHHFKKRFLEDSYRLNPIVLKEIGDVAGKTILHLQCNTGADSIALAKLGAKSVTGVDLVPDNVKFAKQLAEDLGVENVDFIESDIMELMDKHEGKYDIVFTSDGAIGWLPDFNKWGRTLRHFLKEDGYFYVHDGHPFFLSFDEEKIKDGILDLKYPYFDSEADFSSSIGGYASQTKEANNYYWMYTISKLINALSQAGLFIEYLQEYDRCAPGMGGTALDDEGLCYYPQLEGKLPLVFSLKATPR
ncbi:class I SAM-dependent methyltransferase [Alkaliphilus transvaalensis]|uniref:class I SAM-dependent methyltransferase n=1 Tax=Alkaliphilus transvaalensis TaxID=114628 RepID=UPI00047DA788|nr:class I SAM-dependent methyltransferase [Alkaliphilus transvaalensis]